MKTRIIIIGIISLFICSLIGQESVIEKDITEKLDDIKGELLDVKMDIQKDLDEAKDELKKIKIEINKNSAYMGIYLADLTLKKARRLGYKENYGIIITGVKAGSPADIAKIKRDDILMEIDAKKVLDKAICTEIISEYAPKDSVILKIFRNEAEMKLDFVFGATENIYYNFSDSFDKKGKAFTINKKKENNSKSVGFGGGSWIPVYFKQDLTELNNWLENQWNFKDELYSEGVIIHGGGGKGNVGKGLFVGGMAASYSKEFSTLDDSIKVNGKYSLSFGGVTLDKRYSLSKKIKASIGFMIGGGNFKINVTESYTNLNDSSLDWDNINSNLDLITKASFSGEKKFLLFQPKVMLMYRLNSWLSIRSEIGYLLGYSSKGWETKFNGSSYSLTGAPDVNMDGITFSIGPWFGF